MIQTMIEKTSTHLMFERLKNWNLDFLKEYLVKKEIYSEIEIDEIEREYKRFLAISLTNRHIPIPISDKIDAFWHTHIIFTHNYIDMGKELVNDYIHHNPAIGKDLDELKTPYIEYTLSLYKDNFGEPDVKYWTAECCKACTCT